jgi:hypothetical protein
MADRLKDETTVVYIPKFREYGLPILDGGTSYIAIQFCPWCGARLPDGLRNEWFDALEKLGLAVDSENIPEKFLSDRWWNVAQPRSPN